METAPCVFCGKETVKCYIDDFNLSVCKECHNFEIPIAEQNEALPSLAPKGMEYQAKLKKVMDILMRYCDPKPELDCIMAKYVAEKIIEVLKS